MNKTNLCLIFICLLIMSPPIFSQIQVGPLVGTNLSGLNLEPSRPGQNINTKIGYTAGGIINFNFSSIISIQLEPAYVEKGALFSTAVTDVGVILQFEQSVDVNYIDIPILIKATFGEEFIKPFLLIGANLSFPVEDTKVRIDKLLANGEDITYLLSDEEIEQVLKTSSLDYGLNFGAGISFPFEIIEIFLQAQYSLGLNNMIEDESQVEGALETLKNRGLQIKTGILFSL